MPYDLLRANLNSYLPFTESEIALVCACFKEKYVERGEFLLKQGKICRYEGLVLAGCFRIYTIDKNGNDRILYFAARDWWIMDHDSFSNNIPSELYIQAIESSKVLLISRSDKEILYTKLPKLEKLFRIMFQKALVAWQRRLVRNHCSTATERYIYFKKTYPEIANKITDRYLASYLGISHEFLSKIKNRLNP
jgi:CRP-like cAMP-binding protein